MFVSLPFRLVAHDEWRGLQLDQFLFRNIKIENRRKEVLAKSI